MAPQAARFHHEADRYDELARDATTDRMRLHLLRLAHHYRSIAEGLEPLASEVVPHIGRPAPPVRTEPEQPAAYAGAKPRRPAEAVRGTDGTARTAEGGTADREVRIRERAYAIWERTGRPPGRDREHWHQAEREIAADDAGRAS